ncbi:hypothetical protein K435DRAFT_847567 [Dendrothele bispora CBS 962.96]|uniref:Uncharacterized protein n=1 Tax=Dendrothele bispora (strain CBS 962.96) TaxID=1314807 RepID=A0A4V4HJ07_DENBC|nr:hypothetical protein K435DRAFT_847567 [Dendrothele bispora CBS 962.96]
MNHLFFLRNVRNTSRTRLYSTTSPKSPHAQWYSDVVPAMIPICLLGSAVYLGLQLAQTRLSHEKYMDAAQQRAALLEAQVHQLQQDRSQPQPLPSSSSSSKRSWLW